jgi:hypothetical protein
MVETSRFGVLPAHLSTVKNAPILTKYQNIAELYLPGFGVRLMNTGVLRRRSALHGDYRPTECYRRVWSTGLHRDIIFRTGTGAFGLPYPTLIAPFLFLFASSASGVVRSTVSVNSFKSHRCHDLYKRSSRVVSPHLNK